MNRIPGRPQHTRLGGEEALTPAVRGRLLKRIAQRAAAEVKRLKRELAEVERVYPALFEALATAETNADLERLRLKFNPSHDLIPEKYLIDTRTICDGCGKPSRGGYGFPFKGRHWFYCWKKKCQRMADERARLAEAAEDAAWAAEAKRRGVCRGCGWKTTRGYGPGRRTPSAGRACPTCNKWRPPRAFYAVNEWKQDFAERQVPDRDSA